MFGKNKTLKFSACFKTCWIWKIDELKIENVHEEIRSKLLIEVKA